MSLEHINIADPAEHAPRRLDEFELMDRLATDLGIAAPESAEERNGSALYRRRVLRRAIEFVATVKTGQSAHERESISLIKDRDEWEEKATRLAEAIGELLDFDVGEHSSSNCPIDTAQRELLDRLEAKGGAEAIG